MGDSPQAFINEMLALMGLEIGITRLVGKSKLGQNKEKRDVLGAAHAESPRPQRNRRRDAGVEGGVISLQTLP
jgi:predicted FMN-binding regulatory protein PaiB